MPTGSPTEGLQRRFDQYVLGGVERLKARGYNPTLFLRLIKEHGGAVGATKVLLGSERHTSYGFAKLWEMGELSSSVEFAACLPWFRDLFTPEEQDEAERRLILHDFPLEGRLLAEAENPPAWLSEFTH
jgi:hypothetical protein